MSRLPGRLRCIGSPRRRDSKPLKKSTETCIVVQHEINVLQAAQPKWNLTIAMFDGENSFSLFKRKGDFIHHIGGLYCGGRKNHHQVGTLCQSVLDRTVPALTGLNVQAVHPHCSPSCAQVFGKALCELAVFMSVAKESKLNWFHW